MCASFSKTACGASNKESLAFEICQVTRRPTARYVLQRQSGVSVFFCHRVELRGLEPLTPCMPCRCATSCAIAPNVYCAADLTRTRRRFPLRRSAQEVNLNYVRQVPNPYGDAHFQGLTTMHWTNHQLLTIDSSAYQAIFQ